MEMIVRRSFEGSAYTVGHLYIEERYFCDTLEPPVRELPAVCPWTVRGETCRCAEKVWGSTAIPRGRYSVAVYYSRKFRARMVGVLRVPHFSGILLHQGNTVKDTAGCILVGRNTQRGRLTESLQTMRQLRSRVWEALAAERVWLRVEGPLAVAAYGGGTMPFDPLTELPAALRRAIRSGAA